MDISSLIDQTATWLANNSLQLSLTVLMLGCYIAFARFSTPKLVEEADHSHLSNAETNRSVRMARLIARAVALLMLAVIWGIDFRPVLIFATSILTLLGVAFFASWSLLSHITAHFLILMHPSFRQGTFIRIIDADNYTEGYISELGLFSTKLITENREAIVFPNNLLLTRQAIINPKDRLDGVGKLKATNESSTPQ